jgi:hypothetical protein
MLGKLTDAYTKKYKPDGITGLIDKLFFAHLLWTP